ncbi:universal stress protein [Microbacterium sp. Bi128]|uniref:universal stress protein n=1 Tax=Microbacterium sp. Bi128 TaxID=2821115 RepID=UPI001DCE0916|nr:universal stress protein [Microbacterium sp. Bi128]CAH0163135.1 Universal stress protein MT2698 [Microbacterium sp. Bi128]
MSETIAVGVTDASGARRALQWAIERAVARRERLLLVSVVGSGRGVGGEEPLLDHATQVTEAMLESAAAQARSAGATTETLLERGDPVARLLDVSQRVDLLVLGSDFAHGGSHLRGVRGVRITAAAHCPVVVVPDDAGDGRTGVVVGVDGSESSEKAVAFAAAEADRLDEPLTAVMTWSPVPVPFEMETYPPGYFERMQDLTAEALAISLAGLRQDYPDLTVHTVVESGYPAAVIARTAHHARLLVVGSHGRGAIARFLLGSTSQALLDQLPTVTAVIR